MTTAEFEQFFRRYYRERILELARGYPEEGRSLTIHWDDLYQFDPDLADELRANPQRVLADATMALREFDLPVDVDLVDAAVHLAGYSRLTQIRDLRASHVNRLIAIRGIVRKATPVRPKVEVAVYECLTCAGEIEVVQRGQELREPNRCPHCERNTQFDRLDDRSRFVDSQRLRIQESPEGLRGGETPENIDIHLEDDLTGIVSPGDRVTATGVLRLKEQSSGGVTSPVLDVFIEGVHIEIEEEEFEVMDIEEEDIEVIRELTERDDIYERVVDSIAPSIWGYEDEKFAMALQLFSGVRKPLPDGSRVRGDIHVLLVGDPGTGKSQLLQYITKIAPRSVYTSGKGSSAAGLCVTGDTRIHMPQGAVPIRELIEPHISNPVDEDTATAIAEPVYSYDSAAGDISIQQTSLGWRMPKKPCRSITTSQGKTLTASLNTPVLVREHEGRMWRAVSEIDEGNTIAVSNSEVPHIRGDGGVARGQDVQYQRVDRSRQRKDMDDSRVADSASDNIDLEWEEVVEVADVGMKEVFDLTVPTTHNFVGNGIITHNTAAAVRDDFGDGSQWSLEAGALVLADQGIAAVDELDKMRTEDRSAMHEALEQQSYHPDFEIELVDGSTEPIGDLVDRRFERRSDEVIEGLDCEILPVEDVTVLTAHLDEGRTAMIDVDRVSRHEAPDEFVRITFANDESITVTPEHPVFVTVGDEIETWPAEELSSGLTVPGLSPFQADGGLLEHASEGEQVIDRRAQRIINVEVVPNAGELSTNWVYDVTVEPTHTFVSKGVVLHNSVSVSKAGINATLQARCALLGAANPKYGRFDQYEPIPEQIELEPALISRFDLIFTVDDLPDQDRDKRIAEHILQTNYAGELNSRHVTNPEEGGLLQKVEEATEEVTPTIDPQLLRKYVAYATQTCIPTMTMEAREAIKEFYLDLRGQGVDEDSPVPMTARKLEALVRLAEASARIRLSDEVTEEDAKRVIELVRASMGDIGLDPETGAYDVDMIETGTPKTQRDRIRSLKQLMEHLEEEFDDGIPLERIIEEGEERGMEADRIEHELSRMKQSGEIYEPSGNRFRLA